MIANGFRKEANKMVAKVSVRKASNGRTSFRKKGKQMTAKGFCKEGQANGRKRFRKAGKQLDAKCFRKERMVYARKASRVSAGKQTVAKVSAGKASKCSQKFPQGRRANCRKSSRNEGKQMVAEVSAKGFRKEVRQMVAKVSAR